MREGGHERERGDSLRLTLGDIYPRTDTKYIQVTNVKERLSDLMEISTI